MYDPNHHASFATRVKNLCSEVYHLAMVEGVALDLIYVNEATGGEHADFGDGAGATEGELEEAIYFIRQLKKFVETGKNELPNTPLPMEGHVDRLTPFIQQIP